MVIKSALATVLRETGLWYPIYHLRQARHVVSWVRSGCPSPPPHLVKLHIVRSYCRRFGTRTFIETGTHVGETTEWMARTGIDVVGIELSHVLYERARARLARYRNVKLVLGDSSQVLPDVLSGVTNPACFWLDAHFSGEGTARGAVDSPVMQELEAILGHQMRHHVILIDDARCFSGKDGWPLLEQILGRVRQTGSYLTEVSTDIIRITPKADSR